MVLIFAMLAGCLSTRPPAPVSDATEVATVVVMASPEHADMLATPLSMEIALTRALSARGLGHAALETPGSFYALGTTQHRLNWMVEQAHSRTSLLVETAVRPRGHMGGRFRWQVDTTISVATDPGGQLTDSLTVPVTLQHIHQQEAEALTEAAPRIAERAAALVARQMRSSAP